MIAGKISKGEAKAIASEIGKSIEYLARAADINTQTFYKKKDHELFGSKSTRKILDAAEKILGKPIRPKVTRTKVAV